MPEPYDILAMSEANPDGGGVGRWDGERSRTLTGFIFSHWEQLENTPCLIHFRLATHGAVEPRDCHPLRTDRGYIAHDGTAYGHENGPYASDSRNMSTRGSTADATTTRSTVRGQYPPWSPQVAGGHAG